MTYWYLFVCHVCPACGDAWLERLRRYSRRPVRIEDRRRIEESYCGCLDKDKP